MSNNVGLWMYEASMEGAAAHHTLTDIRRLGAEDLFSECCRSMQPSGRVVDALGGAVAWAGEGG